MGRLVDTNDVYNVLTEYYHHKTATQHMVLADALSTVKTADAIPVDWLESYAQMMVDDDRPIFAENIQKMVDEWKQEQTPHCGPDYCDINFGGQHDD